MRTELAMHAFNVMDSVLKQSAYQCLIEVRMLSYKSVSS